MGEPMEEMEMGEISPLAHQLQFLVAFYRARDKLSPGDQERIVINRMIGTVRREIRAHIRDTLADRLSVFHAIRRREQAGCVAVVVQTTEGPDRLAIQVFMVEAGVMKVECFINSIHDTYEGKTACWVVSPIMAPPPHSISIGSAQQIKQFPSDRCRILH